ncbi:MAG: hypothetical protein HY822_07920 [Acidobacteria bacterium]|nr:hypothetical protein [Acidobacteriota bacterium]
MEEATGSGCGGFRRECECSDSTGRTLVIRRIDLRPGEVAEAPEVGLWNLGRWLADTFIRTALAEMIRAISHGTIGSADELRARLGAAFRSRSLVVVRPSETVSGHTLELSETAGSAFADAATRDVPPDLPVAEAQEAHRGWEISGHGQRTLVAKKGDLPPGKPAEEPAVPLAHLDRWLANPEEKAKLVEMYKAVYGLGDFAWAEPGTLKAKLAEAFESRELLMLRQIRRTVSSGGSSAPRKRHDKRDEFVQQPHRRWEPSAAPVRRVDPATFGPAVDTAAIAATMRQAANLGIPFCEECPKRSP